MLADTLIDRCEAKPRVFPILFVVLVCFVTAELLEGSEEDRAVRRIDNDTAQMRMGEERECRFSQAQGKKR
ncbi:MAG: hypothetical protein ACRETL_08965 [Gammaproteobacteria bacterium]